MRPTPPTFFLLDGPTGWRQHDSRQVVAGEAGLRLGVAAGGPLALGCTDGSLGGLVLPRGVAVGPCGIVWLLGLEELWLRRYEAARGAFADLPEHLLAEVAAGACRAAGNLAVAGGELYLADPAGQVLVFAAEPPFAPRARWRLPRPVDVAAAGDGVYLLAGDAVLRCRPGDPEPEPLFAAAGPWRRLAVDLAGRIYLLRAGRQKLAVFSPAGEPLGRVDDSGAVRGRFPPPAVSLDHRGRFRLPPQGLACGAAPVAEVFDRRGEPAAPAPAEPPGPALYAAAGSWFSQPFDSDLYRCEWHRVELELGELPAGSVVRVRSFCDRSVDQVGEVSELPDHLWQTALELTGPMQPPPRQEGPAARRADDRQAYVRTDAEGAAVWQPRDAAQRWHVAGGAHLRRGEDGGWLLAHDGLVQSRPGRYLWLRVDLVGDGYSSPRVCSLRLRYPRRTYLDDLPAVFASDEESRWFLNRFLAIFHSEWQDFEDRTATIARYFDPRAVPEGPWLDHLAAWLGQRLEDSWDGRQKRRLLEALPELLPKRGTAEGLRRYLSIYLEAMSGIEARHQMGYPRLVEAFRERRALGAPGLARGRALWGRGELDRLQLGVDAEVGRSRLVSIGDPRLDPFHRSAHRFRVFVPAAWVASAEDESLLRRAVESEKPAHTLYDLCLVEPRARVGIQATVGIDTVIGAVPRARLPRRCDPAAPPCCRPPASRAPHGRLGVDTVLAPGPPALFEGGKP